MIAVNETYVVDLFDVHDQKLSYTPHVFAAASDEEAKTKAIEWARTLLGVGKKVRLILKKRDKPEPVFQDLIFTKFTNLNYTNSFA